MHIADQRVKELAKTIELPEDRLFIRLKNSSLMNQLRPDATWLIDNTYYFLEYENSARGMLHHVTKYQYVATTCPDINFRVLMVESLSHQEHHGTDRILALFQYNRNPLNNLTVLFKDCTGVESDFVANIKEFLGLLHGISIRTSIQDESKTDTQVA
jgi:hypothetical protein